MVCAVSRADFALGNPPGGGAGGVKGFSRKKRAHLVFPVYREGLGVAGVLGVWASEGSRWSPCRIVAGGVV